MRIVITGSNGQLGRELASRLASPTNQLYCIDLPGCDITRKTDVHSFLNKAKPETIIHCAAYTDVDGCERNPLKAKAINEIGTRNLVEYAGPNNVLFVYVSTDYVFDGKKGAAYTETDQVAPLSIYGRTKLNGEYIVQRNCTKHFIVRTAWLYGQGTNFITKVIETAKKNRQLRMVDDQFGCPTYTKDLAGAIEKLIETNEYGIYHIVNSGSCSRYEFAIDIIRNAGIDIDVQRVKSSEFKTTAARPANTILNTKKLKKIGIALRSWQDALSEYMSIRAVITST